MTHKVNHRVSSCFVVEKSNGLLCESHENGKFYISCGIISNFRELTNLKGKNANFRHCVKMMVTKSGCKSQ